MAIDYTEEELKKLNEGIKGLALRTKDAAKKLGETNKEQIKQAREAIREKRQEINASVKTGKVRAELLKLLEKENDALESRIDQEEKVLEISKKLGDSFIGLGKAAFRGEGSISAFTDNVYGLRTLGNRLDVNIETFRQLSQTGANFGKSIVDLRLAAGEAALPLDDFASLVANNSKNLAALFGTTTQGAKRIAELGRVTREVGIERLAPLGLTVDEINETLLLNLDSQRRTGILGRLTDAQRTESAINFAEQLDRLAKLTGQQRDELRAAIESQKSNERFQAALQGQTDATRQRLQAFAGTVEGISPQLAEGFQDLIANAGVPVTESALALVQNIPGASAVIRDLISGAVSSEEALVRIRDISANSVDRFRQATVTGQVEFLRLQGGIIELGRRVTDSNASFAEQRKAATSLVSNLTSFEQATKVLASQFQGIETALLQSFGPQLGGLVAGIQSVFGAGGVVAKALAGAPALTASLLGTALIGKVLFGPAVQTLITAKGVAMGIRMSQGMGMAQSFFGGGKGGKGGGLFKGGPGPGGAFGSFARSGVGRVAAPVGLAMNAMSAYGSLTDDDKKNDLAGMGTIAGSVFGGLLGLVGGVPGAMLGASLGGMAGGAIGGMFGGGRQHGGGMDASKMYLTGEGGPEIIKTGTKSAAVANQDLRNTFNTEALESQMTTMITKLNDANTHLTKMVSGVNTLVAIEDRARKAVETTARKDRTSVSMV